WLGTAYGFLRNEPGGAGLALLIVSALAVVAGWPGLAATPRGTRPLLAWMRAHAAPLLAVEAVFLLGFGCWALGGAGDPAVSHPEQPMDLLMLSAVWASPTFPPRDPWLAGYAVSYYYLGYWLVATLGRLADTPPEVAYNVGQACWFGLLVTGCFGMGLKPPAPRPPPRAPRRAARGRARPGPPAARGPAGGVRRRPGREPTRGGSRAGGGGSRAPAGRAVARRRRGAAAGRPAVVVVEQPRARRCRSRRT